MFLCFPIFWTFCLPFCFFFSINGSFFVYFPFNHYFSSICSFISLLFISLLFIHTSSIHMNWMCWRIPGSCMMFIKVTSDHTYANSIRKHLNSLVFLWRYFLRFKTNKKYVILLISVNRNKLQTVFFLPTEFQLLDLKCPTHHRIQFVIGFIIWYFHDELSCFWRLLVSDACSRFRR